MEEITAVFGAILTTGLLVWLTNSVTKNERGAVKMFVYTAAVITLITVYVATTVIIMES